jgi:DNA-directed RNA polymerase subunit RPC12/RpoP
MIRFHCENCGQKFSVPQAGAGKKGRCPKCKNIIVVPEVEDARSVANQTEPGASEISSKDSILDQNLFDIPQESKVEDYLIAQGSVSDKAFEDLQKPQESKGIKKVESEPVPQRKLPWLIDILIYPTSKAGLTMIGIFVGIPLLMEIFLRVLNLVVWQFPPFYVFALFFLFISLIINIVVLLYKYWYLSECVRDSANGQIRAPETLAATPSGEMLVLFLRIFVCIIIFGAPLYYYLFKSRGIESNLWPLFHFTLSFSRIVVSEVGRGGITFHLLLFFAVFFFPMTILSVIMFDSFGGLNPILIVRSIFRTFVPYCGLILLLCVLRVPIVLMREFIVTEVISRRAGLFITEVISGRAGLFIYLPKTVSIYLTLVSAHLLGRFYWKYEERLNWEV